jgi:hypothetical protein
LRGDQAIVNRQALHYTFRWVAEEDRHAHVLEMYMTKAGLITRTALQEEMLRERKTVGKMGADEASHGAFFYDLLIKCNKGDLDRLSRKISAVSNDFKMPVQNNLINYRRQLLNMMRAAPSYRHPDVFTDMMRAVEKASKTYSRDSLTLITPDLGPFER